MPDLISCIIPTYNRAHLLKDAIEGTIRQTYENWELIIIDDRSTDKTEETVGMYREKDGRIKYYKNPGKGANSARNYGIKVAKGEYIAFLDDDDLSLPHRFESQLKAMKKSGSRFLVSDFKKRDRENHNKVFSKHNLEYKFRAAGFPSRWMIKKDLLDQAGEFDQQLPAMQEIDLCYKIAAHEPYTIQEEVVSILYATPGSVSNSLERRINGRMMILEKHEKSMHPLEAAWWYFLIGIEYYYFGNKPLAEEAFEKAANLDGRNIFKNAFKSYKILKHFDPYFSKLNRRILYSLAMYKIPVLVQHPIV